MKLQWRGGSYDDHPQTQDKALITLNVQAFLEMASLPVPLPLGAQIVAVQQQIDEAAAQHKLAELNARNAKSDEERRHYWQKEIAWHKKKCVLLERLKNRMFFVVSANPFFVLLFPSCVLFPLCYSGACFSSRRRRCNRAGRGFGREVSYNGYQVDSIFVDDRSGPL